MNLLVSSLNAPDNDREMVGEVSGGGSHCCPSLDLKGRREGQLEGRRRERVASVRKKGGRGERRCKTLWSLAQVSQSLFISET